MKKTLSVWMLLVRSTLYPLLGLWALVAGAQALLFSRALKVAALPTQIGEQGAMYGIVDGSHLSLVFVLGLVATAMVLALIPWQKGADYTLARLRVGPKKVYFCRVGHAALCYLLYWAVQALTLLAFYQWFASALPDRCTSQSFFMACWHSDLMHGLFPLQHLAVWAKNLLLMLALAAFTARMPRGDTEKSGSRFPKVLLGAALLAGWAFLGRLGRSDSGPWVIAFCALLVGLGAGYLALQKEEADEN